MQSTNPKFAWKDWRKWRTNLSSPGRDLNMVSPKYKTGQQTTLLLRSVVVYRLKDYIVTKVSGYVTRNWAINPTRHSVYGQDTDINALM
jgi:hypothetical protein